MSDAMPSPGHGPAPVVPAMVEQELALAVVQAVQNAVAHVQSTLALGVAATARGLELALCAPDPAEARQALELTRQAVGDSLDNLRATTTYALGVLAEVRAARAP